MLSVCVASYFDKINYYMNVVLDIYLYIVNPPTSSIITNSSAMKELRLTQTAANLHFVADTQCFICTHTGE